jgi:hypothetical protein
VIEPTDEMLIAWRDAMKAAAAEAVKAGEPLSASQEIARAGLAAVLAIVERNLAGPCSAALPRLTEYGDLWCQLRHGHLGDHEMGPTRWKEWS